MDSISEARRIRNIVHDTPSLSAFLANNVYLPRLVALLDDEEDEVVAIAVEVIHFLVTESNAGNRRLMIASASQLLPRLRDMMMDIGLDAKVKTLAIKAYTSLQPYEAAVTTPSSVSSSAKEVDADIINEEYPVKPKAPPHA